MDASKLKRADWILFAEILKPVVRRYPEVDLVEMLRRVKLADAAMWAFMDASGEVVGVVICRVLSYESSYRVFLVEACATSGARMTNENMRVLVGHLEEIAAMSACDAVRITGRKGWGRVFGDYVEVHRTFDKVIQRSD